MRPTTLLFSLLGVAALLVAAPRHALALETDPSEPTPTVLERSTPYLAVQVGIELQAIDAAARDVAASVDHLAESMKTLTTSPSLTEEQRAEMSAVLERVDGLSERVAAAMEGLPEAVEESRAPLTEIATDLAHHVRRTVVLVLAALLVVVILVLLGIWAFTIRPAGLAATSLITRLTSLTKSVEVSVELLGRTNEVQLELARILDAQRVAIEGYRARQDEGGPREPEPSPS